MVRLSDSAQAQQPMIMKYMLSDRNGIQAHNYARHSIGYVVRGKKNIYYGDTCYEIPQGSLFYMGTGNHYTEDIPDNDKPFEQIVFYYTQEQLSRILNNLSGVYHLHIVNDHKCPECTHLPHASYPASASEKNFFATVSQYMKEGVFADPTAEMIKTTELIYLILSQNDCCLKSKVLSNMDSMKENFEQTVQNYIFSDISVDELASKCNRSLTSFKKEFRKHFYEPPHKWFIRQRLMHSRLLLISTNKSISEIGNECTFPNTSHFIKLFKKEYGMTPSHYRHRHTEGDNAEVPNNTIEKTRAIRIGNQI